VVIDGFLHAVGPIGTVAAPTLWYHHTNPPMDLADSDINHSVSAIGARAEELTRDHGRSGGGGASSTRRR
jgi:hypothetical protein